MSLENEDLIEDEGAGLARTLGVEPIDDEDDLAPAGAERAAIEAKARAMGWKPKEEFRGGPPSHWLDAPEFIQKGEDNLPILRDNLRRMAEKSVVQDRELAELRNTASEQAAAIADLRKLANTASERGYQRALTELEERQDRAVELGDAVGVKQARDQIIALERERAKVDTSPPAPPPVPAAAPMPQEIVDFAASNPWWNVDRTLSQAMIATHTLVMNLHPDWSLKQQLADALRRVKTEFPDRFGAPAVVDNEEDPIPRPRAPAVATPRGGQPQRPAKSGFDSIEDPAERAEARKAFERIKRQQPDYTEAEYLALLTNPHADVLEIQRQARKRSA